ncbi:hypothetical protein [Lacticaseibacillus paracasei]|jgi:hypothetical protein
MKKSLLVGFSLMSALLLASCSSTTSQSSSKDGSKISSLKKDIASLKSQLKEEKSNSNESEDSSSAEQETKTFGINEEAIAALNDKKYFGLKLTSATKTFDDHGQSLVNSDVQSLSISNEKSVQFTFNYINYADDEGFLPSLQYFTVYGPDNVAATIVNQQEGQDSVSIGRSSNTTFWANFSQPIKAGDKVQIEFKMDNQETPFVFSAQVN